MALASELCSFKGHIFNLKAVTRIDINPYNKKITILFGKERYVEYTGLSEAEFDVLKLFLMSKSTVIDVPRMEIRVEMDRKMASLRAEIDENVREVLIPPKPTGENIPEPATPRVERGRIPRTPPASDGMGSDSIRVSIMDYFNSLLDKVKE